MNGGSESGGGDNYGGVPVVQVPIGWQRRVEPGTVVYVSPSGTILTSMDQLRTYLVTDGTCKCGLECPLNVYKVFNFDPRAVVKRRSAEDVKAEEDMTKLCNHRRKIVALATLYKSIESTPLALQSQAAGCGSSQNFNTTSNSPKMGQHPCSLDPDIFTKLMMEKAHNMPAHHLEKPLDHKSDAFTSHPGERYSDLRSSQRPALPRQHGTPLGESYALRNCPPVPSNGNYEVFSRTPQAISHELCTSSFTQVKSSQNRPSYPSCSQELSGLSPKPLALNSCSFVPGGNFNRTLEESIQGSRRQFVFPEKDPLGILDSNSCRPPSPKHHVLNSPPLIQSQVPLMNPHPTPEHNPGNHSSTALPPPFSPFTRSGALTSPSTTRSSMSSISSPAGSVEPSPQRSRHSSASSEHFPAPIRSSSRSPRPVSSPKRSVPHSPKAILEGLPPFGQAQLGSSSNASHALTHQSNKTAPPVSLGAAQGLLGFPLGCILGQQANASFPASSLLTAAAKAQMANQTKPEATTPSTLPSRVLNPNTLLSATVTQDGRALPSRTHSQKRDLLVKRKRQRNSPGPDASPQDVSGYNPTSPSGLSKLNSYSKLTGTGGQLEEDMGRSKAIHSHSVSGHVPPSLQMPRSSVEESPSQSKTPNLSPASQDISNHLLGLVGQLVQTSTEQNSGTSLPLKLPSTPTSANPPSSSGKPSQSPVPKSPLPNLPQSNVVDGSNELPCSLTSAGDSFSFLGQEHVMPFSTPALLNLALLGSLPLSLSLNQHQQLLNQGLLNLLSSSLLSSAELGLLGLQNPPMALPSAMGDPDSNAVQALLMASLLQNPLLPLGGLGLPQIDLPPQNQQQSALLSSLAPLLDSLPNPQNDTTEKHETPLTLPETFPENTLQPLLFPPVSASPALMALNSALLAASLGAVDSSACPGQSIINTSCTGSGSITTTTNSPALSEGKLPPSEPHSPFHLQQPQAPGRLNTLMPPLLNPLLTAGLLGDLAALNTSTSAQMGSLQSLLGAQALLQNQQAFLPSLPGALGIQFFQGQSLLQGQRSNNQNNSSSTSEKEVTQSPHPEICITPTSQIPSNSQQALDSSFATQRADTNKSQALPLTPSRPGSFVSNASSAFESSPIPKGPPFQGPVRTDLPPDTPSDPPRTDTLPQSMDPSASETEPEASPLKKCRLLADSVIPSEIPNGASPNILPWMGSPHPSNTVNIPEMDLSKGKERGYRFNGRSRAERSYGRRPRGDRLSNTRHSYWRYNGEDTSQNDGEEAGQSQEITQPVLGIPPFTHHWHEEAEQPREQEVDVPPQLLKRSRRGRRRGQNSQRMGSRIEAVPAKWPTMDPANGLNAERPIIRQNRPGRPAKNRRRRII